MFERRIAHGSRPAPPGFGGEPQVESRILHAGEKKNKKCILYRLEFTAAAFAAPATATTPATAATTSKSGSKHVFSLLFVSSGCRPRCALPNKRVCHRCKYRKILDCSMSQNMKDVSINNCHVTAGDTTHDERVSDSYLYWVTTTTTATRNDDERRTIVSV